MQRFREDGVNLTTETLVVFLLLMPGFLSSSVLNAIVVRTAKDRTGSVIEALVFSFLIYAILAPFGRSPLELEVTGAGVYRPTVDTTEGLLYVSDPVWIEDDGNYSDLGVHGILITNKDKMESIMFTHVTPKSAKAREGEQSHGSQ